MSFFFSSNFVIYEVNEFFFFYVVHFSSPERFFPHLFSLVQSFHLFTLSLFLLPNINGSLLILLRCTSRAKTL